MWRSAVKLSVLFCVLVSLSASSVQIGSLGLDGQPPPQQWVFPQAVVGRVVISGQDFGIYSIELRLSNTRDEQWNGRLRLLRNSDLGPMTDISVDQSTVEDASNIDVILEGRGSTLIQIDSEAPFQTGVLVVEGDAENPIGSTVPSFTYRLRRVDGIVTDLISVPPAEASLGLRGNVALLALPAFQVGVALVRQCDLTGGCEQQQGAEADVELLLRIPGGEIPLRRSISFGTGSFGLQVARTIPELFVEPGNFSSGLLEIRSNSEPIYAVLISFGDRPDFEDIQNGVAPLLPINLPPEVDAGMDRVVDAADGMASFNLMGRVDDDGLPGGLLTIEWSVVDGPAVDFDDPTNPNTVANFMMEGTYELRLFASDGELSNEDTVVITINLPPQVDAGEDQELPLGTGNSVVTQLMGTATDADLGPESLSTTWALSVGDPEAVTIDNPTQLTTGVSFSQPGEYEFTLTATDGGENPVSDSVLITVLENRPPTADAGPDQTVALGASGSITVFLNGSGDDPDQDPLTFMWSPSEIDFADPTGAQTSASFTQTGSFDLTLTASDSQLEGSDTVRITVVEGNQPPTVDAGPDQNLIADADGRVTTQLDGTVTDDGLPAGETLTVLWSADVVPGSVTFNPRTAEDTTVTFNGEGSYTLRLTANDGALEAFDLVIVVVDPTETAQVIFPWFDWEVEEALEQIKLRAELADIPWSPASASGSLKELDGGFPGGVHGLAAPPSAGLMPRRRY